QVWDGRRFGPGREGYLSEVSILKRPVFIHRIKAGSFLLEASDLVFDFCIADGSLRFFYLAFLILLQFNFRNYFKRGFKADRLALFHLQIAHQGLRNGLESFLQNNLAEMRRHQRFKNLALDLLAKSAAYDAGWDLAMAEARDTRPLGVALDKPLPMPAGDLRRDFHDNLAAAGRVHSVLQLRRLLRDLRRLLGGLKRLFSNTGLSLRGHRLRPSVYKLRLKAGCW